MATTNYNLPTITGNMTADVVRDMNALAEATDGAIKEAVDGVDLSTVTQQIDAVDQRVTTHLADKAKHNQFMHEGVLHQIGFGYNPTLGCFTYSIREVV